MAKRSHRARGIYIPKKSEATTVSVATISDMRKHAPKVDEKWLPQSTIAELEALFMKGKK